MYTASAADRMELLRRAEADLENRSQILDDILHSDGLTILSATDDELLLYDELHRRELPLRLPGHRVPLYSLIRTDGTDVDTQRVAAILEQWVPRTYWMTLRCVVCLPTPEAVRQINRETHATMNSRTLAQFVVRDAAILLNMPLMEREAQKMARRSTPLSSALAEVFWTTLLHELRHVHQHNPLLEGCFAGTSAYLLEEDAETFCRRVYSRMSLHTDCQVFRRFMG